MTDENGTESEPVVERVEVIVEKTVVGPGPEITIEREEIVIELDVGVEHGTDLPETGIGRSRTEYGNNAEAEKSGEASDDEWDPTEPEQRLRDESERDPK